MRASASVALLLSASAIAFAQPPTTFTYGSYVEDDGKAAPIAWTTHNVKASETTEPLRLEVEPKVRGTTDSAVLPLAPLRLYTLTMSCRRGPGLGFETRVNWVGADKKPGSRYMVWQLPDRFRINWWPLSALKNTYKQRFCLPPEATQVTLQFVLTGHPDAGYNYFELYDLSISRGAEVPFGHRLGPNLCPGGDMEAANAEGMALGWGFWMTPPDAKVLEKDAQGRPAHGGRHFLSFPAGKNCILVDGVIPVQPGRAYRLSFWARGKGDLGPGVQSLEAREGQRVADAQVFPVHVETDDWQQYAYTWFAESLWLASANIFMGITTQTELDLDDFVFQLVGP